MHVTLVTPWDSEGGIAHYSRRFATALKEEAVDVSPVPIKWPNTGNPRRFNTVLEEIPHDTDVVHVQFEAGVFGRLGVSGVCAPSFFRRLNSMGPTIVTTLHEVHATHPHQNVIGDYALRSRDFLIERYALQTSAAVIVHTKSAREVLRDRHGRRGEIIQMHHPVEMDATPMARETARDQLDYEGQLILTFGWVEQKKRYGDVIDVLPDLPQARYLIAGKPRTDRDRDVLEAAVDQAERLGVRDRVHHIGYVDDAELPVLFSAADVVVLPYGRVSQSGALNIALGYHRPVLTSSLEPFEELRAEFGSPETYVDRDDLHHKLETLLNYPSERERLIECAVDYARQLTWTKFAQNSVELYQRTAGDDK